jgi:hypothetical protein
MDDYHDKRDKFGRRVNWSFLGDDDLLERFAEAKEHFRDAAAVYVDLFGERATRAFLEELYPRPKSPGRPPKQEENEDLIAQVESKMACGVAKTAAIRAVAVEGRSPIKKEKISSLERRLWRQKIEKPDEVSRRVEEDERALAEYERALAEHMKRLVAPLIFEEGP